MSIATKAPRIKEKRKLTTERH